jgi:nucleoside 2-deoxyribosyltransferase
VDARQGHRWRPRAAFPTDAAPQQAAGLACLGIACLGIAGRTLFPGTAGLGQGVPMRVYLAGPDVFLPDPQARGAELKRICARHGLHGVFPLDELEQDEPPEWAALPLPRRIALRNEAHILGSAALIANLTPFRGPSADVGTVFELGFMRALGRPVFGWSNGLPDFTARTLAFLGGEVTPQPGSGYRDAEGMGLEAFGCLDNLMIDGAVAASGGCLEAVERPVAERWRDLAAFERCVTRASALLGQE